MNNSEMSTRYDAAQVESKWYQRWEESGAFSPGEPQGGAFVITIPPPNITGSLHMGHALCYPLQDVLGRYHRLQGKQVVIVPGQDHAGIATQSVVTKKLKEEGRNPVDIGREAFEERAWEWREESGDTILRQFRALGCGFDWNRQRFTLDDDYIDAVLKVFIDWFDRDLIYQGLRVVNWDVALRTSISDLEAERKEVNGSLYHVRYPFSDGDGEIIVATTRPETMLADVAVAVHPDDPRYKGMEGRTLTLPLVGREIPLVFDRYPDPEFGTGAVKITPGHDGNDFEVGQRHDLEVLTMMEEDGTVKDEYAAYAGLDRRVARKRIVEDLEEHGFLIKTEPHKIAVQISQRSGEIIEPYASLQWFVKQSELAQPVIKSIESDQITFAPERYKGITLDWLNEIKDWCISRQLWWGHRIPIYYTEDGTAVAARSQEEAEAKAGKPIVRQEEDVLDTWFSSGLWPFATLGWPESTPELESWLPTSVLVTARDIIYLWVARMAMMSLDFTGKVPFKKVYVYATVLNEHGQRMSKSLGTGVDPMGIIESKGADALRYALFSQTGFNQDIRYSDRKTDDGRNFANKIWNSARFILMQLDGEPQKTEISHLVDRWILSRLARCEVEVRGAIEAHDMQTAMQSLYRFWWSEVCDWYIEISKDRLADGEAAPRWVLLRCLRAFLAMLHPFMPFITEELYHHLPGERSDFLSGDGWPQDLSFDKEAEGAVEGWLEAVRALRALRAELGVSPMKSVPTAYVEGDLGEGEGVLSSQAWIESVKQGRPDGEVFVSATAGGIDMHLPTGGLVDPEQELARLAKEEEKAQKELRKVSGMLGNAKFVQNAKPEVVEKAKADQAELEDLLKKLEQRKKLFGG